MTRVFTFDTAVAPEWIDYNGHMRDSNFGLVFSLAVDAFQDAVGFDAAYRARTGCTIYLLEDHKRFLREVMQGQHLRVETRVLAVDAKRFHLHQQMFESGDLVCVGEVMELHVRQHPSPKAAPMPSDIHALLQTALMSEADQAALPHPSRALQL